MDPVTPDILERLLDITWSATWRGLVLHYSGLTWAFALDLFTDYGVYLVSTLGLFVMFAAGQVSLGHAGLVGITAYSSAVLVVKFGTPFWLAVPLSGVSGALAGLVYCYLLGLRLTGFYLAIGTFAFGEALITVWLNSEYLGGAIGFVGIPLKSTALPVFAIIVILIFALWRLEKSRFWLAFQAIRESQVVAGAMGINVKRTKLLAWGIGGFITGIGGSLHAHRVTVLSPTEFSVFLSIVFVLGVLLGGLRTFWGTVLGGAFVYFVPWLTTTDEPRFRLMFYGIIIVLVMVFMPRGLLPAGAPKARSVEDLQRMAEAAHVPQPPATGDKSDA